MKCRAFHRDTFGMGFHQVIARNVECCSEGIQTGDHNETFHRIGIGVSNTDSGYPPQPPLPHRAETPPIDSTICACGSGKIRRVTDLGISPKRCRSEADIALEDLRNWSV